MVIEFDQRLPDAWNMTLREYWMLHIYKYPPDKTPVVQGVDHNTMTAMKEKLRAKGFDV